MTYSVIYEPNWTKSFISLHVGTVVLGVVENRTGSLVLDRQARELEKERAIGQFNLPIKARHCFSQGLVDN